MHARICDSRAMLRCPRSYITAEVEHRASADGGSAATSYSSRVQPHTLLASLLTVHGRSTGGAARPGTKGSLPTNFHSSKAARACSALPACARWIKSFWSRRRSQHQRPVFSFVPLQVTCRKLISISVHFRTQHLVRRSMAFDARRVVIKPCAYVHRFSIALAAVLFLKGSL